MMSIGVALAFAALASPSVADAQGRALTARIADPDKGVIVVAHRGCHNPAPYLSRAAAPENSLAALENCVALGVDVMEADVRRTRDGHFVIIHDETVDRTTTGHGRVADLTLAQINTLFLRDNEGGADAEATSQRVLTLTQLLDAARGRIVINLDIKDAIYPEVIAAAVAAGASERVIVKTTAGIATPPLAGMTPYDRTPFMPVLSSADSSGADLPAVMRRQGGGIRHPIGYELPRMTAAELPALAAEARRQHVRLWVNTLSDGFVAGFGGDLNALRDPTGVWGRLISIGVTIIQSDEPEALIRYRCSMKDC